KVRFAASRRRYLATFLAEASKRISASEQQLVDPALPSGQRAKLERDLATLRAELAAAEAEGAEYTDAAWEALPPRTRSLHERAFTVNIGDPQYRSLAELAYHDGSAERTTSVPAGDVLFQFRHDVEAGSLPAV